MMTQIAEGDASGVRTIACDESGSEGENLTMSAHPVFVHGSVSLTLEEAEGLREQMRSAMRAQAPEMKSKTALAPRNRAALLDAMKVLEGKANIYFVEKSYFVVGKLLDLLVAEMPTENDFDVAGSGLGRHLADHLHDAGPSAVGEEHWAALLNSYNALIRSYLRQNDQPPTIHPFLAALHNARVACTDSKVQRILDDIWAARYLALEYEGVSRAELRELDPMAPSLASVSMTWHMRLGGQPFAFLIDTYSILTDDVREAIVAASRVPLSVGNVDLPRADLRRIEMIDSRLDARVQIADVIAGVGREVARLAMNGVFDDPLQELTQQMLDFNVMCSSGSPLNTLTERAPLQYFETWMAGSRR